MVICREIYVSPFFDRRKNGIRRINEIARRNL